MQEIQLDFRKATSAPLRRLTFSNRNPYTLTLGEIGELVLPVPSNLVATPSADRIKLVWTAIPEAISYNLKLGDNIVGTTTESSYIFQGLESQTGMRII